MTENNPPHQIMLLLNHGYLNDSFKDAVPEFDSERETVIGYKWQPSANGPESFQLILHISAVLALVGHGFLNELTKDLYAWTKTKLLSFFNKNNFPVGDIVIEFNDVVIYATVEKMLELKSLWVQLPKLLEQIDSQISTNWSLNFHVKEKMWKIQPLHTELKIE